MTADELDLLQDKMLASLRHRLAAAYPDGGPLSMSDIGTVAAALTAARLGRLSTSPDGVLEVNAWDAGKP